MLYHGTCADNLNSILNSGLNAAEFPEKQLWTVSAGFNYFWDSDLFEVNGDFTYSVDGDSIKEAKCNAGDNAISSLYCSKDCRRIIIEVDKKELDSRFLEEDVSCNNMDGAVRYLKKVSPKLINRIWIDSQDLSIFRLLFIQNHIGPGKDLSVPANISALERRVAKKTLGLLSDLWEELEGLTDDMEIIYERTK